MSDSSNPRNVAQQHKLAKDLLRAVHAGEADAQRRMQALFDGRSAFQLADAQLVIAREAGFDSWTRLIEEAGKAELAEMKSLLHRGDALALRTKLTNSAFLRSQINAPLGGYGARPLHLVGNRPELIDVLIEFGADPNLKSDWQNGPYTVLDHADEPTARHLLSRGAALTPNVAARLGWIDELRAMLRNDPGLVHTRGGDGKMPLHEAKTVAIADLLLELGADPDARCLDHHSTPAMYALIDRPAVCEHLLTRGAKGDLYQAAHLGRLELARQCIGQDPACLETRVNFDGYAAVPRMCIYCWTIGWYVSPAQLARRAGHAAIVALIESAQDIRHRLLDAAWDGDLQRTRQVREADPQVISRFTPQEHALLAAAAHLDRPQAVRALLDLGFDVNARANDGGTALHQACWIGSAEMVEMLLATGKCLLNDQNDQHQCTPIGWAAYGSVHCGHGPRQYERVIRMMAGTPGVDLTLPGNRHGGTIAGMARGNAAIEKLLVELGAG